MATAQNPATPKVRAGVQPIRAGQGTSFLWRKLHSLLGIIPIGAFFIEHLLSNFEALKGPTAYAAQVKFLNALPLVRVLEWTFIFIPILAATFAPSTPAAGSVPSATRRTSRNRSTTPASIWKSAANSG